MNKTLSKILVAILFIILIVTGGLGYYVKSNRIIDDKDYSVEIKSDEDFEYEADYEFEYIEERIIFSDEVEYYLSNMTNEEKIAQLFFITPEDISDVEEVSFFDELVIDNPVGGIIYSSKNINDLNTTRRLINDLNNNSLNSIGLPILSTYEDEIPLQEFIYTDDIYSPNELSKMGDNDLIDNYIENRVLELNSFGLNTYTNLNINLDETEDEYFGSDPIYSSEIISSITETLKANNKLTFVKTFPVDKETTMTIDNFTTRDFIPLQASIDNEVNGVFLSNNICKSITESASIAVSQSENTFDTLRGRLGFEGIAIARDLKQEEILNAFLVGCDMFYMPQDYKGSYNLLLDALNSEKIPNTRINNSLGRIIEAKLRLS